MGAARVGGRPAPRRGVRTRGCGKGNADGAAWKRVPLTHFREERRTRPAKKDFPTRRDGGNTPQVVGSVTDSFPHSENHC